MTNRKSLRILIFLLVSVAGCLIVLYATSRLCLIHVYEIKSDNGFASNDALILTEEALIDKAYLKDETAEGKDQCMVVEAIGSKDINSILSADLVDKLKNNRLQEMYSDKNAEIWDLEEEIKNIRDEDIQEAEQEAREEISEYEKKVQKGSATIKSKTEKLNQAKIELASNKEEIDTAQSEIDVAQEQVAELKDTVDTLEDLHSQALEGGLSGDNLKKLENALREATDTYNDACIQLEQAKAQLSDAKSEYNAMNNKIKNAERKLNKAKADLELQSQEVAKNKKTIDKEVASIKEEKESKKNTIEKLEKEKTAYEIKWELSECIKIYDPHKTMIKAAVAMATIIILLLFVLRRLWKFKDGQDHV